MMFQETMSDSIEQISDQHLVHGKHAYFGNTACFYGRISGCVQNKRNRNIPHGGFTGQLMYKLVYYAYAKQRNEKPVGA